MSGKTGPVVGPKYSHSADSTHADSIRTPVSDWWTHGHSGEDRSEHERRAILMLPIRVVDAPMSLRAGRFWRELYCCHFKRI